MGDGLHLDRLAAKQHGAFNSRQVRDAGFDKHAVGRRLRSRQWIRLDYRVFALASAPATWERHVWAALLSRNRAVVGGRSAASIHGLRAFTPSQPVLVVPGSANTRSTLGRMIRAEHFKDLDIQKVGGFPVTSVEETLVCLAADLGRHQLIGTFDDALLTHKVDMTQMASILEREGPRRRAGIVLLRDLVEEKSATASSTYSSYLEGVLEGVLARSAIPHWSREHPFVLDGQPSRVDVYIVGWCLVIEADGRNWHTRTEDFENDRIRDNSLAAQGIQVLRFTYQMLTEDPEGCRRTIEATGRLRSAPGLEYRDPLL